MLPKQIASILGKPPSVLNYCPLDVDPFALFTKIYQIRDGDAGAMEDKFEKFRSVFDIMEDKHLEIDFKAMDAELILSIIKAVPCYRVKRKFYEGSDGYTLYSFKTNENSLENDGKSDSHHNACELNGQLANNDVNDCLTDDDGYQQSSDNISPSGILSPPTTKKKISLQQYKGRRKPTDHIDSLNSEKIMNRFCQTQRQVFEHLSPNGKNIISSRSLKEIESVPVSSTLHTFLARETDLEKCSLEKIRQSEEIELKPLTNPITQIDYITQNLHSICWSSVYHRSSDQIRKLKFLLDEISSQNIFAGFPGTKTWAVSVLLKRIESICAWNLYKLLSEDDLHHNKALDTYYKSIDRNRMPEVLTKEDQWDISRAHKASHYLSLAHSLWEEAEDYLGSYTDMSVFDIVDDESGIFWNTFTKPLILVYNYCSTFSKVINEPDL